MNTSSPRLLDQVREIIRIKHYSIRTEQAYVQWIRRYILYHGKRHPRDMGAKEVSAFLSSLAITAKVAASTQNQALNAILFLYREVLKISLPWLEDVQRAKRPKHLPVVLTRDEVKRTLAGLECTVWLIAALTYGAGLRLMECLRLRVKDLELDRGEVLIRDGKGQKDRISMLPRNLRDPVRTHLAKVRQVHEGEATSKRDSVESICLLPWTENIPMPIGNGGGSMSFRPRGYLSIPEAASSADITAILPFFSEP